MRWRMLGDETFLLSAVLLLFAPLRPVEAQDVDVQGNLTMRDSTDAVGNVLKEGVPFLHNFGTENTFLGTNAGNLIMSGQANTISGVNALRNNTTGSFNAAHGNGALLNNTAGSFNTASGAEALFGNTTGSFNTAVGLRAGLTATPANANTTGSNNTFIGFNSGPGTHTQLTNATAIGANALVSASNAMVLGDGAVNVGIGTAEPAFKLDVAGPAHATDFVTCSDARLKKNVQPLSNVLEKIEKIRGVAFDWNERYEALGRSTGKRGIGVIAQEVEEVFPELVTAWGEEGYRAVDYGRLTGALIEAIKEQQVHIRDLRANNSELKARLEALEGMVWSGLAE